MRNFLIVALGIAVCILGFKVYSLNVAVNTLKQSQKAAESTVVVPSIELQSRCSEKAEKVFKVGGWSTDKFADYVSHFNTGLGKCFVNVRDSTTDKYSATESETLIDAFEGKQYGSYLWINVFSRNKKYWEVSPTQCKVTLPSGEEKECRSQEEFHTLAKVYME